MPERAFVVLLVASSVNRTALGMLLILAFSAGLAVVLTGIGLMMVYSRGLLNRFKFNSGRPSSSADGLSDSSCLPGLLIAYSALSQGGSIQIGDARAGVQGAQPHDRGLGLCPNSPTTSRGVDA